MRPLGISNVLPDASPPLHTLLLVGPHQYAHLSLPVSLPSPYNGASKFKPPNLVTQPSSPLIFLLKLPSTFSCQLKSEKKPCLPTLLPSYYHSLLRIIAQDHASYPVVALNPNPLHPCPGNFLKSEQLVDQAPVLRLPQVQLSTYRQPLDTPRTYFSPFLRSHSITLKYFICLIWTLLWRLTIPCPNHPLSSTIETSFPTQKMFSTTKLF